MVHLVTGYLGKEHVTSADQGAYNAAIWGVGEFVVDIGEKFTFSIIENKYIRVRSGGVVCQGRFIKLDGYEDLEIEIGENDKIRKDIIALEYKKDAAFGVESAEMIVIKGTETEPTLVKGNIIDGELHHQMPMFRVTLDGFIITKVEPLFSTVESLELMKTTLQGEINTFLAVQVEDFNNKKASILAAGQKTINNKITKFDENMAEKLAEVEDTYQEIAAEYDVHSIALVEIVGV